MIIDDLSRWMRMLSPPVTVMSVSEETAQASVIRLGDAGLVSASTGDTGYVLIDTRSGGKTVSRRNV